MHALKEAAVTLLFATLFLTASAFAADNPFSASVTVPRLVNYSGKILDQQGKPTSGIAGVLFSIYKDEEGGAPLWMESQNVTADKTGHYTAQLGATKPAGLPLELFTFGGARWLGVTINSGEEQARVLLISVPYALRAADAETLGGKPASAYMMAPAEGTKVSKEAAAAAPVNPISCTSASGCKTGALPLFVSNGGSAKIGDSIITQTGKTVNVAGFETVAGNITSMGSISAALYLSAVAGISTPGLIDAMGANLHNTMGPAVIGTSTGPLTGADGVDGIATNSDSSGVTGVNNAAGGIGVTGAADIGFYTPNNVRQARTAGGWVKAMVFYSGFSNGIAYCFNSTLAGAAASTPPCGFTPTRFGTGDYQIDFGFAVDDRFFSASGGDGTYTVCTDTTAIPNCAGTTVNANQAEVITKTWQGGSTFDTKFYLIVY